MPARATYALESGITVVPFDGPQSLIMFSQNGVTREDSDFLTSYVVNEVFGGGRFGTRLMRE
jgi:zinc protease